MAEGGPGPGWTRGLGGPADLWFTAKVDGTRQYYVEMLPTGSDEKEEHDVLVGLHGHGSDRWQYVREDRGECRGARDFAAAQGMIFVAPDYRAKTSWMGPKAEADMVQLIGLLRERHKVRRVFLTGGSMGGTSVLIFAALHPEMVAGVSSLNGTANMLEYGNFTEAVAESYGGGPEEVRQEYEKRSPELRPERFTMPVAMVVGGKDTAVPPESVRRLAARMIELGKKDVLLVDREEGGHSTNYEDTVATLEFIVREAEKGKRTR